MREIKFRGYYTGDPGRPGGWVYGSLVKRQHPKFKKPCFYIESESGEVWIVEKESIGQYTNLKDKFDTEIYEGDIVKTVYTYNKKIQMELLDTYKGMVMGYSLPISKYGFDQQAMVVVGNFYESPELLNIDDKTKLHYKHFYKNQFE